MRKELGIVIVNWNNQKEILDCLASLKNADYFTNVVIVDNGSEEKLKSQNAKLKVIENKKNLGYAEGNNIGIRYLLKRGAKYILILNPDTIVEKDTIGKLLKVIEKDKRIGIVGPKIYTQDLQISHTGRVASQHSRCVQGFTKIWSCGGVIDKLRYSGGLIGLGEKDRGQYDKKEKVDYISGTAMLIKREVFDRIGLFHGKYFGYYEDVELCLRARKAGFRVIFVPKAVIYHKESSSFVKDSPAHSYYMARNHLLFVERNAPCLIKIRELIRLPKTIWEHWRKRERFALYGIKDYILGRFGRLSY